MKHESNTEFFINVGKLAEIIEIWQAPEADIEGTTKLLHYTHWMIFAANQEGETTIYHLRDGMGKEVATFTDFKEVWNHERTQKAFKELVYELCNRLYKTHDSPIDWDESGELAAIARETEFTLDRLLVDYIVYWAKEDAYKLNCVLEAICQKLGTTLKVGEE